MSTESKTQQYLKTKDFFSPNFSKGENYRGLVLVCWLERAIHKQKELTLKGKNLLAGRGERRGGGG